MASTGPPQSLKRPDSSLTREGDQLIITPLGAGNEVGRSCVYMSYKGKTILFDCGIHPAYSGMAALPYFDEIDPSTIDVLLVTHIVLRVFSVAVLEGSLYRKAVGHYSFHLDHAASLPYFLEKTTFKGRVFMTHATKAIYKLLLSDYVKVSKVSVEDMLYDEQDILRSMDKIETLEVNGIRFWCYTAGHVLGAAMFMVDIAGVRVLYTGDYSREEDRHLRAAEIPQFSPDICIIESTYGRAQELLLILDEYWSNHPELHNIPIYYASPLAKRCMAVYQTYINSMNERIRNQFANSNPFDFKHISPLKSIENFNDVGPSVVMASPSGLQSGLSRQLFDMWCSDKKNACVIPGYVVEGTLAKTIINEPKEVTLMNGLTAPSTCRSSCHLTSFLSMEKLMRWGGSNRSLSPSLLTATPKIISPKNCQSVEMYFNSEKMAKTIGRLAEKTPGVAIHGKCHSEDYYSLHWCLWCIKHRLKQIYESVESLPDEESEVPAFRVHERVTVKHESEKHISLHWTSDPISDMVSDSIVALSGNVESENEGLKERVRVAFQRIQNAVSQSLYLCLSSFPQVVLLFDANSRSSDEWSPSS
ncbi:Cleavage and polyadenylation specificity factor subunit 3-I [Vitis vinifera]|uniref:Cleavage and polyadenylation specificity factor subunit 3-I n=1 Tax=Vitis vinifera TaxID=29760 RepID=A0A438GUY6_VITVI|nr:Cleavage and polyadenylation specificity factor subunit 3-I [Vitis vinifera]